MKFFVLGDEDTVLGFQLAGVEGKVISTAEEVSENLKLAFNDKHIGIIIIPERLAELARQRQDSTLLLNLLCYDWLRCGHRFLPEELAETPQPKLRDHLRRTLPQEMDGLFSSRTRTEFLKQSVFLQLSAEGMAALGMGGKEASLLAVLPEQGGGVLPFNKTAILPL